MTDENTTVWDKELCKNLSVPYTFINQPKQSNWTCYLFGGNAGFSPITWTPQEGKVPNAWVRFWMKVFFDCNWVEK